MMAIKRIGTRWAELCLGAWLCTVAGCAAKTGATPPPASRANLEASAEVDPSAPRALPAAMADDPNAVGVTSTIRKVTVYSDRALVSREGKVALTTAATVYAFRHLPGWVDEGTVRAATTAGRILDVQVVRGYLARATEKSYRKAENDARALSERLVALDDEIAVLDAQSAQIEDIKAFSLDKLNKDVVAGELPAAGRAVVAGSVGVRTYADVVEFIGKKMREIAKGRRAVKAQREALEPKVSASNKRLEDLRGLRQLEETNVFVTVQAAAPAESQLQLSYLLPGATWEAAHELRASGDGASVELTSYAVVTQATGENWDDAELTFSTQSSTESVRIPELKALTLGDTRGASQSIERRSASFQRAEAAFQGQNRLWNKRVQSASLGSSFEESYKTNFEYLQVIQSKTVELFQSLQQRGTTAQFKGISATKVRADGRSVRVPLGRASLKAKQAIVAAPEQSLNAARTLELLNDSGQSLLPGNVALYQAGAFLGMTNLDFVADGEPFSVFLKVADQIKLSRVLDKKRSALVRKQRTQMQLAFVVSAENLSGKAVNLTLADRVPVSEDRDIVISGVKITPDVKPDSKGILRWPLKLEPKQKRTFLIQYQIEYPPTLVLEMKRREAAEASAPAAAPLPSPRKAYDLKRDIQMLENAL
ncbi:MAG: mucoidy inhibitor MuiA family protein [Polyangiaceae bacterium]